MHILLVQLRSATKAFGDMSFAVAAHRAWNGLSPEMTKQTSIISIRLSKQCCLENPT